MDPNIPAPVPPAKKIPPALFGRLSSRTPSKHQTSSLSRFLEASKLLLKDAESNPGICNSALVALEDIKSKLEARARLAAPVKTHAPLIPSVSESFVLAPPKQSTSKRSEQFSWVDAVKHSPGTGPPNRLGAKIGAESTSTKNALAIRERSDSKQERAKINRENSLNSKVNKARLSSERMREVAERKTQKLAQAQAELEVRHEKAEALHEAYVNQIKSKAENESNKVKELQWISSMTTDFKKSEMKQKMDGAEARRLEIEEERKRKQVELVDPKKSVRFKKICKYCQTEIRGSEAYTVHFLDQRHIKALKAAGINVDNNMTGVGFNKECIIKVPVFPAARASDERTEEEIQKRKDQDEARSRRAKKAKQKLVALIQSLPKDLVTFSSDKDGGAAPQASLTSVKTKTKAALDVAAFQQKLARLVQEGKDQLTKRHIAIFDATLQKLFKHITTPKSKMEINIPGAFVASQGLSLVSSAINLYSPSSNLQKPIESLMQILLILCKEAELRHHLILSNQVIPIMDLIIKADKDEPFLPSAVKVVAMVLRPPPSSSEPQLSQVMQLHISYALSSVLFDKLRILCGPEIVIQKTREFLFFIEVVRLLSHIAHFARIRTEAKDASATELIIEMSSVLSSTNFVGMVQHLASVLLMDGPARKSRKQVSRDIHFLSFGIVEVLKTIAQTNIALFQTFFGNGWDQVELYHVANYLLAHLVVDESDSDSNSDGGGPSRINNENKIDASKADLRDSLIELIGLYCTNNPHNQHVVNWGHPPTIFQKLLMLPFAYFSSRKQRNLLFPTLLSLVFNNRRNLLVLQNELSTDMLVDFIKELQTGKMDAIELAAVERTFPSSMWAQAVEFLATGQPVLAVAPAL